MGCCGPDELCEECQAEAQFTSTFYFDNHRVIMTGCKEAVEEVENQLNSVLKERIPKIDHG